MSARDALRIRTLALRVLATKFYRLSVGQQSLLLQRMREPSGLRPATFPRTQVHISGGRLQGLDEY